MAVFFSLFLPGVGAAAFLAEIAPAWLRRAGSFVLELLAAIPSVVYGFWGLQFLAPGINRVFVWLGGPNEASGQGILAAGLILAILILPYITAISFDDCRAVPWAPSGRRQRPVTSRGDDLPSPTLATSPSASAPRRA